MSKCRHCKEEFDLGRVLRTHGEFSRVFLGKYCSAQCYTKATVPSKRDAQEAHMKENPYLYKCDIR